ncbi:MAG: glycosyltransferase family 9 protein [Flavobacteriales bacterium]
MHSLTPQKILLVRFSSIGDIVLTFPVAAAIKSLYPNCQVDYVTKPQFRTLLEACPEIDNVFTLSGTIQQLRKEINLKQYDAILDLHHNLRTRLLLLCEFSKVYRFPKNNFQKWKLTAFKIFPKKRRHVVERYLSTLADVVTNWPLAAVGNPYFIPSTAQFDINARFNVVPKSYVALAIGAQFATKRLPTDLLIKLVDKLTFPVLLLGGPEDVNVAEKIVAETAKTNVYSAAGKCAIHESAWLVKNAIALITHDTGLMHIGASFDLPLHVIWGNTIRDFGMYPYRPEQEEVFQYEVTDLSCRPCSKIGYQSCPKGHFDCMRKQDLSKIAMAVNSSKPSLQ